MAYHCLEEKKVRNICWPIMAYLMNSKRSIAFAHHLRELLFFQAQGSLRISARLSGKAWVVSQQTIKPTLAGRVLFGHWLLL